MPDPLEHATGLERRELEAIAAGNDVSTDWSLLCKKC